MKTNFDLYLEEQLKNPDFAARFAKAGEAWDIAVQEHQANGYPGFNCSCPKGYS